MAVDTRVRWFFGFQALKANVTRAGFYEQGAALVVTLVVVSVFICFASAAEAEYHAGVRAMGIALYVHPGRHGRKRCDCR